MLTIRFGTTIMFFGVAVPSHFNDLSSSKTILMISSLDNVTGSSILNLVLPLNDTG
jgi:hypothetical protein